MKILGFTTSYPRSITDDASIFVHRLYKAIAESATVTVAAPSGSKTEQSENREGVLIHWFKYLPYLAPRIVYGAGVLPNLKRYPWRAFELPLLVLKLAAIGVRSRSAFDVIHANWILAGCGAWLVHLRTGKPYVITLRGSDTMLFKIAPVRWMSRLALRSAAAVTAVSEQMKTETISAFPWLEGKVRCIENGVESTGSPRATLPALPERYLVAVGSVIPRKRLELAIEILSKQPLKGYSLVICGKTEEQGYLSRLKALSTRLGVGQRVHFLGALAPDQIEGLLKRAIAFLACSEYEGRPNAVLESLSAGTLVLASDIPAHRGILVDGETALLFRPSDLDAAANRLSRILADEGKKAAVTSKGAAAVASSTWAKAAAEYLEVLSNAAGIAH